jgi:hypothetical protein
MAPASATRIATTVAKIGRSMKKATNADGAGAGGMGGASGGDADTAVSRGAEGRRRRGLATTVTTFSACVQRPARRRPPPALAARLFGLGYACISVGVADPVVANRFLLWSITMAFLAPKACPRWLREAHAVA